MVLEKNVNIQEGVSIRERAVDIRMGVGIREWCQYWGGVSMNVPISSLLERLVAVEGMLVLESGVFI